MCVRDIEGGMQDAGGGGEEIRSAVVATGASS